MYVKRVLQELFTCTANTWSLKSWSFFLCSGNYILVRNSRKPVQRKLKCYFFEPLCIYCKNICNGNFLFQFFWQKPYSTLIRWPLRNHSLAKTSSFRPAGARSHKEENLIARVSRITSVLSVRLVDQPVSSGNKADLLRLGNLTAKRHLWQQTVLLWSWCKRGKDPDFFLLRHGTSDCLSPFIEHF